jgi:glycerophosphoryl diester phosphodiesterase
MVVANPLAPLPGITAPLAKVKPLGARGAIRVASHTTWRQPQFYLLTVMAMQLLLLFLAVPLLQMLYYLVLVETGLGSVAYDQIALVLSNPLADLTLLILACIAVLAVFCEFTTLFILAAHHQAGDSTSFRLVLRQMGRTLRKLWSPGGVLILIYLLLLLPLAHFGLSSTLTKQIGVPPFVSEELFKSATTSWAYVAFLVVLAYVNLRLILTLPVLATTSATVGQAFVTSWRLTRWRTLRLLGMLILLFLMVLLPVALLFGVTLLPTVVADFFLPGLSAVAAAVGLAAWQVGVFFITAQRTVLIVQGLVAVMHDWLGHLPDRHRLAVHEITYSVDSTVTAARRRKLWLVAAVVTLVAFTGASVVNYGTMTRLAEAQETSVLAHRGFVVGGVENTLPALLAADQAGSDVVEFDILQTKDLKFVVMHDANLQRLAGIDANVKDLTQAELMEITVRAGGMEAKIPSLEQWIALSIKLGLPQLLEVKLHGGESPDLLPRLLAVLDKYKVAPFYTYHSLSRQVVEELKRLRPELVVGFIIPINFGGVPKINADFLVVEQKSFDLRFRNEAWGQGYKVTVWTVNDKQTMRNYIDDNVNGVITDRPDLGVEAREDIENAQGLASRLIDMIIRSSTF